MNHLLANIVSLPFPRATRRQLRRSLVHLHLRDWLAARAFEKGTVRENSVLLIEANDCHGSVIAGFLEYFQRLGFAVDVLVNRRLIDESAFCRCDMKGVEVWSCDFFALRWFFGGQRIQRYRHVVLMSSAGYRFIDGSEAAPIARSYPGLGRLRSLLVVEHELKDVDRFGEREALAQGRVLTLGDFKDGIFACSHCYGSLRPHRLGRPVTFITVGMVNPARKNHAALIQAVEQMSAEGREFKVVVVGSGTKGAFPAALQRHFEVTGRLDYPRMFERMEEADFYLPLLDHTNPDHDRYVTTGITGSSLLIYGFAKVPVIESHFAGFYRFDDSNAIVTDDLAAGMRKAIEMPEVEYDAMFGRLTMLSETLKGVSLENLRRALNG